MGLEPGIGSERRGRWGLGEGVQGPLRTAQSGGRGAAGALTALGGTEDEGGARPAGLILPPAQVHSFPEASSRWKTPSVSNQRENLPWGHYKQLQDPGEVRTSQI